MARTNEKSFIYQPGSSPNTRVAISQKNKVYSTPFGSTSQAPIGVLSTFDYSESRAVDPVRGVGFGDKIAELVPGVTEPTSLTLNRTLMYTAGIVQELGYKGGVDGIVRSLRHHRWPFDIISELVFSELVTQQDSGMIGQAFVKPAGGGSVALITRFMACWLESYSVSFPSDSAIIVEDASAKATDVTDGSTLYGTDANTYGEFLQSGNNPFLNKGAGSRLYGA